MNRTFSITCRAIQYAMIITLSCATVVCAQERDRLIDWQPRVIPGTDARVVEIVDITVNGKSITPGHSFTAGEDWLDTLSFRIRNVSGKTISSFGFGVGFPEMATSSDGVPGFSVVFNHPAKRNKSEEQKPMLADEEVNLKLPPDQLSIMRQVSMKQLGTNVFRRIVILPGVVHYEDGSGLGGFSLRKP